MKRIILGRTGDRQGGCGLRSGNLARIKKKKKEVNNLLLIEELLRSKGENPCKAWKGGQRGMKIKLPYSAA